MDILEGASVLRDDFGVLLSEPDVLCFLLVEQHAELLERDENARDQSLAREGGRRWRRCRGWGWPGVAVVHSLFSFFFRAVSVAAAVARVAPAVFFLPLSLVLCFVVSCWAIKKKKTGEEKRWKRRCGASSRLSSPFQTLPPRSPFLPVRRALVSGDPLIQSLACHPKTLLTDPQNNRRETGRRSVWSRSSSDAAGLSTRGRLDKGRK